VARANELIGAPVPKIRRIPASVFAAAGVFSPMLRAMREMNYQFQRPFTLDSALTEKTFGLAPTPLDESLAAAAAAYRNA